VPVPALADRIMPPRARAVYAEENKRTESEPPVARVQVSPARCVAARPANVWHHGRACLNLIRNL